jgi:butyrate kinase
MVQIVLINGQKRSGKDYTAEKIQEELKHRGYKSVIMRFADPMKQIISSTFNISEEDLDEYKNEPDEYGIELKAYPNNQPPVTIGYTDFRVILQRFGTEGMKPVFGDDVWASLLYNKADTSDCDFVLVSDFRFNIEYRDDTITLKIRNDEIDVDKSDLHASERELDNFEFQHTIDNTGYRDTTKEVREFVDTLEDELTKQIKKEK